MSANRAVTSDVGAPKPRPTLLWGIDLGGTKIEGVVVSADTPTLPVAKVRIPTESDGGYDHILHRVMKVVEELKIQVGASPVSLGLSHPGSIDPHTRRLRNSNTVCMNGLPLAEDLATLSGCAVHAENDANCFTLAESCWGAATEAPIVFGVILGTGCGGGIVVGGRVLKGLQGLGGEWGHNPLFDDGPTCYCGKRGCVEQFISGPALERFYSEETGVNQALDDIYASALAGTDSAATKTIDRLIQCFGKALGTVTNIVDPHTVVIGGGVSNILDLYTRSQAELGKWIFHENPRTAIVQNKLGDSAGVYGAALVSFNAKPL